MAAQYAKQAAVDRYVACVNMGSFLMDGSANNAECFGVYF